MPTTDQPTRTSSPIAGSTSSTSSAASRPALQGLYGIAGADPGPDGLPRNPLEIIEAFCAGGASIVQLRLKDVDDRTLLRTAERALRICRDAGVALVINDRADIAAMVGADGVHVGWDDLPPDAARGIVGPDAWVGVSTHNPDELARALSCAPDYIGFGPIWETLSKTGLCDAQGLSTLGEVRRAAGDVPVVAIGGITTPRRAAEAMRAGAAAVAVISAVSAAADMHAAVRTLVDALGTS